MPKRIKTALISAILLPIPWGGVGVGLTSCTDDTDEPRISGVEPTVETPVLSFYVEDMDGNDLLADANKFSVFCMETGEPMKYSITRQSVQSWMSREKTQANLLTVTLPTPYHSTSDKKYVYTLDPTLAIQISGLKQVIKVKTRYDYDLRYKQDANDHRIAIVKYSLTSVTCGSHQLQQDTLHIIAEDDYPYLRVDGDTLHVQLRFPATDSALPPLSWDNKQWRWSNDLMQCHLETDGRIIAKPYETIATSRHSEKIVTDDGQVHDSTYTAIDLSLPLPYIYNMEDNSTSADFGYHLFMKSPLLFGDDGEHALDLQFYQWEKDIQRSQINVWLLYLDGRKLDTPSYYISYPYHINLNWS